MEGFVDTGGVQIVDNMDVGIGIGILGSRVVESVT